jgi:UDP-N-acetylmuramate--alanine ligase
MDQVSGAFQDADTLLVLPIYAASEEPIPGVTAERLAERIEQSSRVQGPAVRFAPDFAAAIAAVAAQAGEGDLILTLGAGSVSQLAPQILAALAAAS